MDPLVPGTNVTPAPWRPTKILYVSIAVAVIVCGAWAGLRYYPGLATTHTDIQPILTEGLTALNNGDYASAARQFEEGMKQANTINEKGYFETLLATSYESTDFRKAADLYLDVINNTSYFDRTRGLAAAYLMKAVKTYNTLENAQYVFSKAPFQGFLTEGTTLRVGYTFDVALSKGNTVALNLYPNFLSNFAQAQFFAHYYGFLPKDYQARFGSKIANYFADGSKELFESLGETDWSRDLIAYGYATRALAAVEIYSLAASGTYPDKTLVMEPAAVQGYFEEAIAFADQNAATSGAVRSLQIYDRLYYADFLLSLKNGQKLYTDKLKGIADEMESIVSADPKNFSFLVDAVSSKDSDGPHKKSVLVTLASLNAQLEDLLINSVGALSASDFK